MGELQKITVGGKQYMVDEEALNDLRSRKIPFATGEGQEQQPEAEGSTLGDFGRGVAHGASFGLADTKFGDSNQSIAERLGGDDYDRVKERSPIATGVGDLAGSVAVPIPGASAFGAAKGVGGFLARAGVNAAIGAGTGALRAAAEGQDISDAATSGAAFGAAGGAAAEGLGRIAVGAKDLAARGLNSAADSALVRGVFGVGGSDNALKKIAAKFGVDNLPEELAAKIRELVPSESFLGKSRSQYRDELGDIVSQEGPQIGYLREKMGKDQGLDALIPGELAVARGNLQNKLNNITTRTAEGRAEKAALEADLAEFDKLAGPKLTNPKTLEGLADVKSTYQAAGHGGPLGTVPERAAAEAAATIGGEMKGAFDRALQYAKDGTREAYEQANDRYGLAAALHKQIEPKAVREQLNSNAAGLAAVAQAALANGVVGAAGGALGGSQIGEGHAAEGGLMGGIMGALHGATMAGNTGTRNFMTQLLAQPKAMDALSNIMRASGKKLEDLDLQSLARLVRTHMGQAGGRLGYAKEKR